MAGGGGAFNGLVSHTPCIPTIFLSKFSCLKREKEILDRMSRRQVGINKPGKKSSSFFMFCGGGGACDLNSFSSCFTFHVGNRVLGEDGRGKRGKSPQGDLATSGMRKRERISLSIVCGKVFLSKFPRGGIGYRRTRQQPDFHDERKEDIFSGRCSERGIVK